MPDIHSAGSMTQVVSWYVLITYNYSVIYINSNFSNAVLTDYILEKLIWFLCKSNSNISVNKS
jgi:hypothetical protein